MKQSIYYWLARAYLLTTIVLFLVMFFLIPSILSPEMRALNSPFWPVIETLGTFLIIGLFGLPVAVVIFLLSPHTFSSTFSAKSRVLKILKTLVWTTLVIIVLPIVFGMIAQPSASGLPIGLAVGALLPFLIPLLAIEIILVELFEWKERERSVGGFQRSDQT